MKCFKAHVRNLLLSGSPSAWLPLTIPSLLWIKSLLKLSVSSPKEMFWGLLIMGLKRRFWSFVFLSSSHLVLKMTDKLWSRMFTFEWVLTSPLLLLQFLDLLCIFKFSYGLGMISYFIRMTRSHFIFIDPYAIFEWIPLKKIQLIAFLVHSAFDSGMSQK